MLLQLSNSAMHSANAVLAIMVTFFEVICWFMILNSCLLIGSHCSDDSQNLESSQLIYSMDYALTHWGRDKMATIFQTTFWNAFSWMKMFEYRLKFHWNLFLRVQLIIFQHWFRWWLGAVQATSHYLNQWWLVYRCIYASLGLNELIHVMEIKCHRTYYTYIYPLCSEICWGNIKMYYIFSNFCSAEMPLYLNLHYWTTRTCCPT